MSKRLPQLKNALAIPDSFRRTALAFPDKVKAVIAKMDNVDDAADGLAKAEAVANYAKRIKATTEEVNHVQYGKLLLAAKVGELSPKEKTGPKTRVSHPPREKLFHANTLTDYRKLASYEKRGRIEAYWKTIGTGGHEQEMSLAGFMRFVGGNLKAAQNRGIIEWYTPALYTQAACKAMGGIDLDPASTKQANRTVQAKNFYDSDEDGLEQPWFGRVFLNPPFKATLISRFVARLCEHITSTEVSQAVLLTNNNTDTAWWHQAAELAEVICFTRGRVAFYSPDGSEAAPTNGHTFCYFGKRVATFCQQFSQFGTIMEARKQSE